MLDLFPVANLRQAFGEGTKDEICRREAAPTGIDQFRKLGMFVSGNFGSCKQHVYVFSKEEDTVLPKGFSAGVQVSQVGDCAYYLVQASFTVTVFDPPLVQHEVSLLWPLRIEIFGSNYIVRFVILERDVAAIYGPKARVTDKTLDEIDILGRVAESLLSSDLNKGVKTLWQSDYHECLKGEFKKENSVSSEKMDEKKGLKKNYPAIYGEMLLSPIHASLFEIVDGSVKLGTYSVNPSLGTMSFSKYSQLGDTDAVIRQILESNN